MMHVPKPYNPPPADQLETVYVDDDLVVANKPSGLLSVPGLGPEKAVCANSLLCERHGQVLTVPDPVRTDKTGSTRPVAAIRVTTRRKNV